MASQCGGIAFALDRPREDNLSAGSPYRIRLTYFEDDTSVDVGAVTVIVTGEKEIPIAPIMGDVAIAGGAARLIAWVRKTTKRAKGPDAGRRVGVGKTFSAPESR